MEAFFSAIGVIVAALLVSFIASTRRERKQKQYKSTWYGKYRRVMDKIDEKINPV